MKIGSSANVMPEAGGSGSAAEQIKKQINALEQQIKKVTRDRTLSPEEKEKKVEALNRRIERLKQRLEALMARENAAQTPAEPGNAGETSAGSAL
jgi:phage shock protein A